MKSPLRITALSVALLLAPVRGYAAESDRQYQAQDGWRMLQSALPAARKSNREAIRDCFMASYLRASSPFLGGEDCEAIHNGLSELLFLGGDRAFSQALTVERPEVIAAVRLWIRHSPGFYQRGGFKSFDIDTYPKTKKLLDSVPNVDFPINESSPRRAPLLEHLSPK